MAHPFRPDAHQRLEIVVLEAFSSTDFHKVSIRDIADKAEVSFATIYKHYGSKEGLVFAFVDVWMGTLTDRIIDHLQGIEDLKEKLRKVFWLQLDYYERHPGLGRIVFMTLPMNTWLGDKSFAQARMMSLMIDVLKQGQQQGKLNASVRAGVLLDFFMGFVHRSFFMWILRGTQEPLTTQAQEMFEMVWQGMASPEE